MEASVLWQAPAKPLIVTSCFGPRPRIDPKTGKPGALHPGLDLRVVQHQPIFAVADGLVLRSYLSPNLRLVSLPAGETLPSGRAQLVPYDWKPGMPDPDSKGYGENIVLVHPGGVQTRYAHLAARNVQEGEHVVAGQVIGWGGSTGYSFGVHLHFEVKADGGRSFMDPLPTLMHLNPDIL